MSPIFGETTRASMGSQALLEARSDVDVQAKKRVELGGVFHRIFTAEFAGYIPVI